mmetsp:Transcript_34100/g.73703  ORF Transcript_34100/g.73703 Transcript_34100/m.73703 type:complete len:81 (+) Transcript_34100:156-398(+)
MLVPMLLQLERWRIVQLLEQLRSDVLAVLLLGAAWRYRCSRVSCHCHFFHLQTAATLAIEAAGIPVWKSSVWMAQLEWEV